MFEGLKAVFLSGKVKYERFQNELDIIENQRKLIKFEKDIIEARSKDTKRLLRQFEDNDEASWIDAGNNEEKALSQDDTYDLIRSAQKMYFKNPHARNVIRLYEKYIVGRGFQINPKTTNEAWVKYWNEFVKANKFMRKKKEIIRRAMRDGDMFLRFFYGVEMVYIRFMNPLKVNHPEKPEIQGIQTDPEDIESVIAYYYGTSEPIPAEVILHEKIFVDSDVKRGRSLLEVIARPLEQYRDWMADRMKLNKIRAIMGIHRKVKGNTVQTRNIATAYNTNIVKAPDQSSYMKTPEGVSVFTTNQGVEYDLKTPNLQASDVQHDGYALINQIAAGAGGFPNWMVSSDPSNSNYASTLVSEAPGVKELQDWQDFFQDTFAEIYEKVMSFAVEKGIVPAMEETEINGIKTVQEIPLEAHIVFPELVHRDILRETQALTIQRNEGVISKHTYSGRLDLDYDEEQSMIKQEQEESNDTDSEDEEVEKEVAELEAEEAYKKVRKKQIIG